MHRFQEEQVVKTLQNNPCFEHTPLERFDPRQVTHDACEFCKVNLRQGTSSRPMSKVNLRHDTRWMLQGEKQRSLPACILILRRWPYPKGAGGAGIMPIGGGPMGDAHIGGGAMGGGPMRGCIPMFDRAGPPCHPGKPPSN